MELTYTQKGDYLYPDLMEEQEPVALGKYGLMRAEYLRNHSKVTYFNLMTQGKLQAHLTETESAAKERIEKLTKQIAGENGVTESLKETDQMNWVGLMNTARHMAEESVLNELIYS